MGATTIWERWDSMLPDGTINPGEMTSFNHYALGAIGDWLHRVVAGLAPAAPGYAKLRIAPTPLAGFDFASAEHLTPYGRAKAGWRREGGRIVIEAVVPPNTTATVVLEGVEHEVGSGTHRWEVDDAADSVRTAGRRPRLQPRGGHRRPRGISPGARRDRGGEAGGGGAHPQEHEVGGGPRARARRCPGMPGRRFGRGWPTVWQS